ncbi:MAG: CorA family divalent cation transporter [Campylobacterota bacterium]|nr:CorA family divalent cation transporter [Campylobacterota bacterium]
MQSHHILFIPFKFDEILTTEKRYKELCLKNDFLDRVLINDEENSLISRLENSSWNKEFFSTLDDTNNYNAFASFNEGIRSILFEDKEHFDISSRFSHNILNTHKNITLNIEFNEQKEALHVEDIKLRVFETGVGVLKLTLVANANSYKQTIKLNDILSCVYCKSLKVDENGKLFDTHIASKMSLNSMNERLFSFTNSFDEIPKSIQLIDFFIQILGSDVFTSNLDDVGKFLVTPIIEQESFIIALCEDEKILQEFHQSSDHLKKNNYETWENRGNFFALNHSKMLMLAPDKCSENEFKFYYMYYNIILLTLVLDISLNRINDEMITLSSKYKPDYEEKNAAKTLMNIEEIYHFAVNFLGRFHFKEITSQHNATLLYNKLYNNYSIKTKISFVHTEMKDLYSLYNYSEIITQKEQQKFNDKLTILGGLFVPIGVIGGIYGMNIPYIAQTTWHSVAVVTSVTYIFMYFFISNAINRTFRRFFNATN